MEATYDFCGLIVGNSKYYLSIDYALHFNTVLSAASWGAAQ